MGPIAWRRLRLAVAFTNAAWQYWLIAFPLARRELRRLRRDARAIPDPVLRRIALETLDGEHGNLEGAAAFAAFAPMRMRPAVVRATVAFQAAYDYLDSLAEQPGGDAAANVRALHEALAVALRPGAPHGAYYRRNGRADDGGYLRRLVDTCRTAVEVLPSHRVIESHLLHATERMIEYQALIHTGGDAARVELAAWAERRRPPDAPLHWWETAAACASSLGVFALLAAAARPGLRCDEAAGLDRAYFPWIGALHVLLDSLADQPDDTWAEHVSLVEHYASPRELADRLATIATTAFAATRTVRQGELHAMVLTATAAFYLCSSSAQLPDAELARRRVLAAAGELERPTLAVLRARRALGSCSEPAASLTPGRAAGHHPLDQLLSEGRSVKGMPSSAVTVRK